MLCIASGSGKSEPLALVLFRQRPSGHCAGRYGGFLPWGWALGVWEAGSSRDAQSPSVAAPSAGTVVTLCTGPSFPALAAGGGLHSGRGPPGGTHDLLCVGRRAPPGKCQIQPAHVRLRSRLVPFVPKESKCPPTGDTVGVPTAAGHSRHPREVGGTP